MNNILLKIMIAIGVVFLFLQFWLGMNLVLFVSLPIRLPSDFFSYTGGNELLVHVVSGLTVFVLAGLILSYGSRMRNVRFLILSAIGFSFALIAAATGAAFVLRGHDDILSLVMAMSFLFVFTVFLAEYFLFDKFRLAGYSLR